MKYDTYEERELSETRGAEGSELECLAISVPKAGKAAGLGRSAAYEAAKRGDIPTIRIGGRLLVPIKKFRRKFE
jgi:hypothetical protein